MSDQAGRAPTGSVPDPALQSWLDQLRADPGPSCAALGAGALREGGRRRALARPHEPALERVTDVRAAGPGQDPAEGAVPCRLYLPAGGPHPLVVFAHGGGFVMGDLETHDGVCRPMAATARAAVLAVDYRRAPESPGPAAVDDVVTARRWALSRDSRIGVAADRGAALAGDSAGGTIALLAAVALLAGTVPLPGTVPLSALFLACPNADLTLSFPSVRAEGRGWGLDAADLRWFVDQWVPDPALRTDPGLSPLHAPVAGLPPVILATAEHDPLRDEGAALAARLRSHGVPVDHRHFPGLVHGFLTLAALSPAADQAGQECLAGLGRLVSAGP